MGNDLTLWRAAIGLHYHGGRLMCKSYTFHTYPIRTLRVFLMRIKYTILLILRYCLLLNHWILNSNAVCLITVGVANNLKFNALKNQTCMIISTTLCDNAFNYLILRRLILLSGDVETNPGPVTETHSFSILHQNIRSIRNKFEYIKDNFLDYDMLCFTETHLSADINNTTLQLDGFDELFRKDNSAHSGGFLIYVSSDLRPKRILELETFLPDSIWIEIKDHTQTFIIGTVYRPPHYPVAFWEQFNICLEKVTDACNNVILVGDINEDQLNLTTHKFRDILMLNNMINIINEPTRVTNSSSTLIDPIAVTSNILVYDSGLFLTDNAISDHFGTYTYIKVNFQPIMPFKRRVWNYRRGDFESLNNAILTTDWSFLHADTVDIAALSFTDTFLNLAKTYIPTTFVTVRPNDKPWYTADIRRASRQRNRQKRTAVRTKLASDWSTFKRLRNKVNNMKKYAKESFFNNIEYTMSDLSSTNPRQYWKLVKMLVRDNYSKCDTIPPLKNNDQRFSITDEEKANTLNDYFVSISTVDASNTILPDFVPKTNAAIGNLIISEQEITDVLTNLVVNKANGPDEISHRMLKETSRTICIPLSILFNRSIQENIYPDCWNLLTLCHYLKKTKRIYLLTIDQSR